jgi:hypothetical protein
MHMNWDIDKLYRIYRWLERERAQEERDIRAHRKRSDVDWKVLNAAGLEVLVILTDHFKWIAPMWPEGAEL